MCVTNFLVVNTMLIEHIRSASKDVELEATYLRLLKETSPHEKAILRDLGRYADGHEMDFRNDKRCIAERFLIMIILRTAKA